MRSLALLAVVAMLSCGCRQTGEQDTAAEKTMQQNPAVSHGIAAVSAGEELELGRRIYNFRCYFCHGYSGDARTLAASFLNPKPADFTAIAPERLSRGRMLHSIQSGKPGTAMMAFTGILHPREIEAVTDFVRHEFMVEKAQNTRYHTAANGWPEHGRYASAFPFATGAVPLDTPWEQLSPRQAAGKRLFLSACVSCHDRARVGDEGSHWDLRPLSFPRNHFSPGAYPSVDAVTSATPYLLHDRPPRLEEPTALELRGETLYQRNCAFCHAADGTARNWIGRFMEPHPRNLINSAAMASMTKKHLEKVIREGLPGTSMPAWKSVLPGRDIEAIAVYVNKAFHPLGK